MDEQELKMQNSYTMYGVLRYQFDVILTSEY